MAIWNSASQRTITTKSSKTFQPAADFKNGTKKCAVMFSNSSVVKTTVKPSSTCSNTAYVWTNSAGGSVGSNSAVTVLRRNDPAIRIATRTCTKTESWKVFALCYACDSMLLPILGVMAQSTSLRSVCMISLTISTVSALMR